jgi:hypothetical protein
LVTNRVDGGAQRIITLYLQRWPIEIYQSCNLRRTLFWQNIDFFSRSTAQRATPT